MTKPKLTVLIFLLIVLSLPLLTLAQGTLTGTVTARGTPLENISVTYTKGGETIGTITDKDGK